MALLSRIASVTRMAAVSRPAFQTRGLKLHEYQTQELFAKFGINVPKGHVASTPEEAYDAAKKLEAEGNIDFVVKAQVHAGGRGMGKFDNGFKGGVHVLTSAEAVRDVASKMIGHKLITKQTGEEGKPVDKLYICERKYLRRELYFGITMDRKAQGPVMIGSRMGGMDIEHVAATTPEEIHTVPVDLTKGITDKQTEELARKMLFDKRTMPKAMEQMKRLYTMFTSTDATLLEVNPFGETPDGDISCVDAKINVDDFAGFRRKDLYALEDKAQLDQREAEAAKYDLNFIGLSGNVGCLVNGAGLAMSTMDMISLKGGSPANFHDVGGSATEKQVEAAFRIITSDPRSEAIFVNIFGGIARCDVIATGIINAARNLKLEVPVVCRLLGNRVKEAKELFAKNAGDVKILSVDDFDKAAETVVAAANITRMARKANLDVSFAQRK